MDFNALIDDLGEHTIDGLTRGSIYALVALGYTLVYGVLRLINFAHSEVFMVGTWTVLGVYTVLGADSDSGMGMVVFATSLAPGRGRRRLGGVALAVERIAYRPLRKKNAPPLIFLITAIGCSLVLVEIFGFVLRGLLRRRRSAGRRSASPVADPDARRCSPSATSRITNIQVFIILGAVADDGRARPVREPDPPRPRRPRRGPGPRHRGPDGRQPGPGDHADLRPRWRHGRCRGAAATPSASASPSSTSASSSASRRSPPPCSAASATCAARWSVACCSASSRSTPRRCSAPTGRTSPRSSCWSSC